MRTFSQIVCYALVYEPRETSFMQDGRTGYAYPPAQKKQFLYWQLPDKHDNKKTYRNINTST